MERLIPKAYPDDVIREKEMDRIVEADMKKDKSHKCTAKEAEHIKSIIWKYFSHEFAEKVMIAYGRKPGNREKAYDDFWNMKREWANRKKASEEYFEYIKKRRVYGVDSMLSEEENAILFDSGFIHRN